MPFSKTTLYIQEAARITAGDDGMVHVGPANGLPAMSMPRAVAIAAGRALFAAVAELEDRERPPVPLRRVK